MSQRPIPEEFKPSQEDVFPDLTAIYWQNPNAQKGVIMRCPGASKEDRKIRELQGN